MSSTAFSKPRWLRDLVRFLPLKSQFVLSGNVRDLQASEMQPGIVAAVPLIHALANELAEAGYADVAMFQPQSGFRMLGAGNESDVASRLERLGLSAPTSASGPDVLPAALERFVGTTGSPACLIVDFASRLINRNDALSPSEHVLFTRALISSHAAQTRPAGPQRQPFFNTVVWIADKEGDLPDWFLIDNPRIRHTETCDAVFS